MPTLQHLATPLFVTRWRWNVSRSLALLRFHNGKRVPVYLQRMRAEDLLAAAFPRAAACGDNHVGDIPVPDHPLVQETLRDCLTEAMDLEGLREVLEGIDSQAIQVRAVESPMPSPFAHEILNANPYAFLDDARQTAHATPGASLRLHQKSVGRLFCTTRDELVECAAVVRAIRHGQLETIEIPTAPLDILIQHVIAEVAAQEWEARAWFDLCRSAYPYREISWETVESLVQLIAEGFVPGRRRLYALMSYDRREGRLRPRRGGRLAALTSGGAIPETATYSVVAEPDGTVVGTVDEDFAIESLAGDIMLLGTTSWRIRGIETGKVRVEDAHGQPPNIPFWRGEAPSRSKELSQAVAEVRVAIHHLLENGATTGDATARQWLF